MSHPPGRPPVYENGATCRAPHCTNLFVSGEGGHGLCQGGYLHARREVRKGSSCNCGHCLVVRRASEDRVVGPVAVEDFDPARILVPASDFGRVTSEVDGAPRLSAKLGDLARRKGKT